MRSAQESPAERVLAMQRTVGNRAVGAILSRAVKKKPPPAAGSARVKLGELKPIQIEYFMLEAPTGGPGKDSKPPTSFTCVSAHGEHTDGLMCAAAKKRRFKTVLIDLPGMTISLNGAVVSSYGDRPGEKQGDFSKEEWRIDAASAQYDRDEED